MPRPSKPVKRKKAPAPRKAAPAKRKAAPAKRKATPAKRKPTPAKPKRVSASDQFAAFKRASEILSRIEEEEEEDEELLAALAPAPRKRRSTADEDLVNAAFYGSIEHAKAALAAGASPDARTENNHTALYKAVAGDQLAMVEFLLENGADPNATVIANIRGLNIVEITPLTRAKDERKRAIVKVLERHGGRYVYNPVRGV